LSKQWGGFGAPAPRRSSQPSTSGKIMEMPQSLVRYHFERRVDHAMAIVTSALRNKG
jgi:hypothetical protein